MNGCVVLVDEAGGTNHLPLWPHGYYFDGTAVHDGNDVIIASLDDDLELEGGEVSRAVAVDLTGQEIPPACGEATPFIVSSARQAATN